MMSAERAPGSSGSNHTAGPAAEGTMEVRVTYRDTDQMGFVYYANYLVYFEMARTELLRELGRSYRDCERDGIFLPVVEANCRYREPARYDDMLEIRTRVTKWTRVAIDFAYEVRRKGDETVLADGFTRHVLTNGEGRIVRAGDRILTDSSR